MVSWSEHGNEKLVFHLACCWLSIGLLMTTAGCDKTQRSAEHVEVSGNVLYQGQPLPGGEVKFVAINGGFAATGIIDEKGHYQVQAPVGEVEIGVTNRMLRGNRGQQGGSGPKEGATLREKKAKEQRKAQIVKGRWVNIPPGYADPHTSGLKYTVKTGAQSYDIKLTSQGPPAAGAPGS